jgi:hypothetical protein
MPVSVFAMLVFGICTWFGAGVIEPVMRDFAGEAGMKTWVFVIVPGLLTMLFALALYRKAATEMAGVDQALSRALTVAIATWLAITALVSTLWCPGYRAFGCTMNVALVTGIIGGGPLLISALIAGGIVGLVLQRRVAWLSYPGAPAKAVVARPPAEIALPAAVVIEEPTPSEIGPDGADRTALPEKK